MTLNDLICNLAFVINIMFNDIHVGDIKKNMKNIDKGCMIF